MPKALQQYLCRQIHKLKVNRSLKIKQDCGHHKILRIIRETLASMPPRGGALIIAARVSDSRYSSGLTVFRSGFEIAQ